MYLSEREISLIGFASVGSNVKISPQARFYNPNGISVGNNVRIDDFVVLSGQVKIGNYVHLSINSAVISPRSQVTIGNFSTVSFYACITSANDDYSGKFMMNPTLPKQLTNVTDSPVIIGEHVALGSHSLVLPGVTLGKGCVVGAFSLVKVDIPSWSIYGGVPAHRIGSRSREIINLEKDLDV